MVFSGSFGEELGEDYFGFKSIGLDKEYSLDTLNVGDTNYYYIEINSTHAHNIRYLLAYC